MIDAAPNAETCRTLALSLLREKRFEEALVHARQAATEAPDDPGNWINLCNIAQKSDEYGEALHAADRIVALAPGDPLGYFGRGVALYYLDRHEDSIAACQEAVRIKPDYADAWTIIGQSCQSLKRPKDARQAYRRAIEANGQTIQGEDGREVAEDEYGNRHWDLALAELQDGDLLHGFARYRSRFKALSNLKRQKLPQPLWQGEDVRGKTILVMGEQGYGDTLMFCRYLPLLRTRGACVIFLPPPALVPLFGADQFRSPRDRLDLHASVFDLPHRFGTTLDTIPANVPYLPTPAPDARTRISGNGRIKVGLIWAGEPSHGNDKRRSIPLAQMTDLFAGTHAQIFSLTRDLRPGDTEMLAYYSIPNLAPLLDDFLSSARLIGQMDLVITCDTASAHLAGGMGKKVWILLPFNPDWRWLLGRDDSPWYPTARLFRQEAPGDWAGVIRRVQSALADVDGFPVGLNDPGDARGRERAPPPRD
jgi:tetratricopeptide (TPR) repeat protein